MPQETRGKQAMAQGKVTRAKATRGWEPAGGNRCLTDALDVTDRAIPR